MIHVKGKFVTIRGCKYPHLTYKGVSVVPKTKGYKAGHPQSLNTAPVVRPGKKRTVVPVVLDTGFRKVTK